MIHSDSRQRPRASRRVAFVPLTTCLVALAALALGVLSLSLNTLEPWPIVALLALGVSAALAAAHARAARGSWDGWLLSLAVLGLLGSLALSRIPLRFYGWQVNAVFHRSVVSSLFLVALALPTLCLALYQALGATPRAADLSRYPLVLLPVTLAGAAYALLIARIVIDGAPGLSWEILSSPLGMYVIELKRVINGWPVRSVQSYYLFGMRNHILGTGLLMLLTSLISLPIGAGVGLYLSEYNAPRLGRLIRFAAAMLRAMSVFILGVVALGLVNAASGTWLSDLIAGRYFDSNGAQHVANGSYLFAAAVLSVLVVPIVARSAEEGCRSLPQELREGSWALGASQSYTLRRVIIPWALPNMITGLLLGCAEAAGSVATIMFLAGTGQYGLGPLSEVTSLGYLIYHTRYGPAWLREGMRPYRFTAGLVLLLITMGLSAVALLLKRRFAQRYRAAH